MPSSICSEKLLWPKSICISLLVVLSFCTTCNFGSDLSIIFCNVEVYRTCPCVWLRWSSVSLYIYERKFGERMGRKSFHMIELEHCVASMIADVALVHYIHYTRSYIFLYSSSTYFYLALALVSTLELCGNIHVPLFKDTRCKKSSIKCVIQWSM